MAGLTSSSSEARRLIESGGIRLNDASVSDVRASAGLIDLTPEGVLKISVGRKKHALIKPS
jgi:tyrosyl-tRNA synthetase